MKKRIVILSVIFLGIIIIYNLCSNKIHNMTYEGVNLSVGVNGTSQSTFPSMGQYDVDVNCTGADGEWNYSSWELEVSNISNTTAYCNINFNSINSRQKLNSKIIELSGNGQVVNENGYRYEGKNPNNYILFNNELWRIIGVFDSSTHGNSGNLTKIIRNDSIGSYAWDGNYGEKWTNSTLYQLLNDYYYNAKNATGESACKFMGEIDARCDFSKIGLNNISKSLIEKVNWKVGSTNNYYGTTSAFYNAERLISDYNVSTSTSVDNNIGIMYASDYGYSVLSSDCSRTINISDYAEKNCASNSWLVKYNFEWTLSLRTSPYNLRWGDISSDSSEYPFNVRPTVYLKSNVYVVSGDGSYNNPYVIGI